MDSRGGLQQFINYKSSSGEYRKLSFGVDMFNGIDFFVWKDIEAMTNEEVKTQVLDRYNVPELNRMNIRMLIQGFEFHLRSKFKSLESQFVYQQNNSQSQTIQSQTQTQTTKEPTIQTQQPPKVELTAHNIQIAFCQTVFDSLPKEEQIKVAAMDQGTQQEYFAKQLEKRYFELNPIKPAKKPLNQSGSKKQSSSNGNKMNIDGYASSDDEIEIKKKRKKRKKKKKYEIESDSESSNEFTSSEDEEERHHKKKKKKKKKDKRAKRKSKRLRNKERQKYKQDSGSGDSRSRSRSRDRKPVSKPKPKSKAILSRNKYKEEDIAKAKKFLIQHLENADSFGKDFKKQHWRTLCNKSGHSNWLDLWIFICDDIQNDGENRKWFLKDSRHRTAWSVGWTEESNSNAEDGKEEEEEEADSQPHIVEPQSQPQQQQQEQQDPK